MFIWSAYLDWVLHVQSKVLFLCACVRAGEPIVCDSIQWRLSYNTCTSNAIVSPLSQNTYVTCVHTDAIIF